MTGRLIYASTLLRNLKPLGADQQEVLDRAIGGSSLYAQILQKNSKIEELARTKEEHDRRRPEHGMPEVGSELEARLKELESQAGKIESEIAQAQASIATQLQRIGIRSEDDLVRFVEIKFPKLLLDRAKQISFEMLGKNRAIAMEERERYRDQVCSPDIEGLLTADRELARKNSEIQAKELSIAIGQQYQPVAGVPRSPADYGLPRGSESNMIDIQNLERNQQQLPELQRQYRESLAAYSVKFPILGAKDYQPGRLADAPPSEIAALTGRAVSEVLLNIEQVRVAIEHEDLKVWNLKYVVELAMAELGVEENPVLKDAADTHIRSQERDEEFARMAIAALAITTTVVAGLLGGPAVAAIAGSLWGAVALAGDIHEFRLESAASYVSLDPLVADISANEPTLVWILMDFAMLGLDVAVALQSLRPLARALTLSHSAEDFTIFSRGARSTLQPAEAEALIARAARRFGINTTPEAIEVRVSGADYLRALEHTFPAHFLDDTLRNVDEIGRRAASSVVRDRAFIAAARDRNWKLAGTLFHSAAATEGRLLVQAGALPAGWRYDFEYVVQAGKGGSRLDVFLRGPAGEVIEVDWKSTGRSALTSGSRKEMLKHAKQVADPKNLGAVLSDQRSISWVDEARAAWEQLRRTDPELCRRLLGGPNSAGAIQWPR